MIEIERIDNKIKWNNLIGLKINLSDRYVIANLYNEEENALYVGEYFHNGVGQTTRIPLGDTEKTIKILNILGYDLKIINGFSFSDATITKAQGLIQAGFSKLIRGEDNYTVDGTFIQNFLTQEELEYLLSLPETEISLSEIK